MTNFSRKVFPLFLVEISTPQKCKTPLQKNNKPNNRSESVSFVSPPNNRTNQTKQNHQPRVRKCNELFPNLTSQLLPTTTTTIHTLKSPHQKYLMRPSFCLVIWHLFSFFFFRWWAQNDIKIVGKKMIRMAKVFFFPLPFDGRALGTNAARLLIRMIRSKK